MALRVGSAAASHCLQSLSYGVQPQALKLANSAADLLEKLAQNWNLLHPAAHLSLLIGASMLLSCSLVHCDPPTAAKLLLRLLPNHSKPWDRLRPSYLGLLLTTWAFSRSDYPGWTHPAPLTFMTRAERAIDVITHYATNINNLDNETSWAMVDFGLLELLSNWKIYELAREDFGRIYSTFLPLPDGSIPTIYTLPSSFDIRHHALEATARIISITEGQYDIFPRGAGQMAIRVFKEALICTHAEDVIVPTEQIYLLVIEGVCLIPSNAGQLDLAYHLMERFSIPQPSNNLFRLLMTKNTISLLLNTLGSDDLNRRLFAMGQLCLLIKLALGSIDMLARDSAWKKLLVRLFRSDDPCYPPERLKLVGEALAEKYEELLTTGPPLWVHIKYFNRLRQYICHQTLPGE